MSVYKGGHNAPYGLLFEQMSARNTKLNGAELLERLGVPVLAEAAPRVVRRVPFVSMEGNGSGKVSTYLAFYKRVLEQFPPDAEQDWAAMLRRVNSCTAFLAYRLSAIGRGKVRRGEKAGRRVGMLTLWRGISRKARRLRKLEALDHVKRAAAAIKRHAEGRSGFWITMTSLRTRRERREAEREWKAERFEERLRDIAPAHWEDEQGNFTNGWDEAYLRKLSGYVKAFTPNRRSTFDACISVTESEGIPFDELNYSTFRDCLALAALTGNRAALQRLLKVLKSWRPNYAFSLFLKKIEAEAYRAHTLRRVRPPARRSRIPRPPDLLPLPPSAPLAPPA